MPGTYTKHKVTGCQAHVSSEIPAASTAAGLWSDFVPVLPAALLEVVLLLLCLPSALLWESSLLMPLVLSLCLPLLAMVLKAGAASTCLLLSLLLLLIVAPVLAFLTFSFLPLPLLAL